MTGTFSPLPVLRERGRGEGVLPVSLETIPSPPTPLPEYRERGARPSEKQ